MKTTNLTFKEAVQLLEIYEDTDEISKMLKKINIDGTAYQGEFADAAQKHLAQAAKKQTLKKFGLLEEEENLDSTSRYPVIGDIAYFKIKLNNTNNIAGKNIFNGCETRLVLIINIHDDKVDGLEVTHSKTFKGMNLIPIGKIKDNQESYVNIYNSESYKDLDIKYQFPLFDDNHKPISFADYCAKIIPFAKIKKSDDDNEPYLFDFCYDDTFVTELPEEKLLLIFKAIKEIK